MSGVSLCIQVKPQTVSNLLWAYATLGWAPTHLLTSLAIETVRQLPYFKPQELSNTLWSYATLGYTPMPEWLGQMGVACEGQIGGCKPQELSSLVWALASLRFHPGAACLYTATDTANRLLPPFLMVDFAAVERVKSSAQHRDISESLVSLRNALWGFVAFAFV